RIANRILGMGDIVSLVEKAAANIDQEKALAIAERMKKGKFDLNDLRDQLGQMEKMGGMGGLMGMLPGVAKFKDQIANANIDEKMFARQIAIINSMTPKERANPDLLKNSRKKRIAAGSGTDAAEINKLLKMHRGMADMMKSMGGKKGGMGGMAGRLGQMFGLGGGGMGGMPQPTPEQIEAMQKQMGGGKLPDMPADLTKGIPQLPPSFPGLGKPGLPGLGGKGLLPGLGGFNPFGGTKK
ncbi:MAG: signal recognition particle protein, partial [Albidovulum sp.]